MSIERVSFFFIFIASFVSCLVFPPTWDERDAENKLMYSYAVFCGNEAIMKWDCYWCKKADIKPLYILHNPKVSFSVGIYILYNMNNLHFKTVRILWIYWGE